MIIAREAFQRRKQSSQDDNKTAEEAIKGQRCAIPVEVFLPPGLKKIAS